MTVLSASLRIPALTALLFCFAGTAAAQDTVERPDWILSIGAGAQVLPKYPGSDEIGFAPMVFGGLRREGQPFPIEAPDDGWGFGLLPQGSTLNFGPAVRLQAKRKEEDVGAPVGEVDFAVEAGGFVQLLLGRSFRLRAEGRRGITGHDGWTGDLAADFVARDDDRTLITIGPRLRYADGHYHETYFGVTPAVAAATGLPAYDPGGGFYALGATAGVTHMVGRNWGIYAYASYDRLIGDAADSPIVRTLGSRNQYAAGLGLLYSFNVGSLFGR